MFKGNVNYRSGLKAEVVFILLTTEHLFLSCRRYIAEPEPGWHCTWKAKPWLRQHSGSRRCILAVGQNWSYVETLNIVKLIWPQLRQTPNWLTHWNLCAIHSRQSPPPLQVHQQELCHGWIWPQSLKTWLKSGRHLSRSQLSCHPGVNCGGDRKWITKTWS